MRFFFYELAQQQEREFDVQFLGMGVLRKKNSRERGGATTQVAQSCCCEKWLARKDATGSYKLEKSGEGHNRFFFVQLHLFETSARQVPQISVSPGRFGAHLCACVET
jgi:hypothetical protein